MVVSCTRFLLEGVVVFVPFATLTLLSAGAAVAFGFTITRASLASVISQLFFAANRTFFAHATMSAPVKASPKLAVKKLTPEEQKVRSGFRCSMLFLVCSGVLTCATLPQAEVAALEEEKLAAAKAGKAADAQVCFLLVEISRIFDGDVAFGPFEQG